MTTYSMEDLKEMTPEKRLEVFLKATKITGTAVVRDKHGNVKYDDPGQAGTFEENVNGSDT